MIASLPMYLRPENRAAHDVFWRLIRDGLRARGIAAPDALDHDAPIHATWGRPDLVLGQICNYPYRTAFAEKVTLIGAGDYGLPGAGPGEYYSVFIARRDDPRNAVAAFDGAPFAYNSADSQSGWAAPCLHMAAEGHAPGPLIETGGHRASARAVLDGSADFACLDAVTWRLIQRWDGWAGALHAVARTAPTPGLTFITAAQQDPAPYRAAIAAAVTGLTETDRDILGLTSVVPIPRDRYLTLPTPPAPTS